MLVLAWDTATAVTSLALVKAKAGAPPEVLLERLGDGRLGHSEYLPPMVKEVLAEAGATPRDLSLVACGRGPGGFTGLRTGLALAKGLGMGAGIPTLGLGSLDVLAAGAILGPALAGGAASGSVSPGGAASAPVLVAPLVDARRQEVFTALYRVGSSKELPERLSEVAAIKPARLLEFLAVLNTLGAPVTLAGPGISLIPGLTAKPIQGSSPGPISDPKGSGVASPPILLGDSGPPRAAVLAVMAARIWAGHLLNPAKAAPLKSASESGPWPERSLGFGQSAGDSSAIKAASEYPLSPIYGRSPEIFKTWAPPVRLASRSAD